MKKLIIGLILIKLLLLLFGSHPFDFWTFVNTFQRGFLFDFPLFEHWNKGNLYHILVLPFFGLYTYIISFFGLQADNILLLHFFMKLPFFFLDIFCGFLIYKIIQELTKNEKYGYYGFLLWFLNPFIYFVYGIHGHYELLTLTGILVFLYGLVRKNIIYTSIGFGIAFVMKYWIIIFTPFLLLYYIYNKDTKKNILYGLGIFFVFVIFSYIHLLSDKVLFYQTFESIIHLSKVNVPDFVKVLKIPSYNIFSSTYFLLTGSKITNIDNPFLFKIASNGLIISGLLIFSFFIFKLKKLIKVKKYDIKELIRDFFVVLVLFFIFSSNFQTHYLVYFVAFFIILTFIQNGKLIFVLTGFTVLAFLNGFRGELGPRTYFMDLNNRLGISFLLPSFKIDYLEGSIIILFLLLSLFYVFKNKKVNIKDTKFYFYTNLTLYSILFLAFLILFNKTNFYNLPNKVAFAAGGHKERGITEAMYNINNIDGNKILFSDYSKTPILDFININNKNLFTYNIISENEININKLNNCNAFIRQDKKIKKHKKHYLVYTFSGDCVKTKENILYLNNEIGKNSNIKLYIKTIPNDSLYYLSSKKYLIYGLSILGLLYIFVFGYFSVKILNLIIKEKDNIS